jgi:hypothetical protein
VQEGVRFVGEWRAGRRGSGSVRGLETGVYERPLVQQCSFTIDDGHFLTGESRCKTLRRKGGTRRPIVLIQKGPLRTDGVCAGRAGSRQKQPAKEAYEK